MGLSLFVGMLSVLEEGNAEGFQSYLRHFENINKLLAAVGLPEHREPRLSQVWDAQMYGYSGLHYLRRIAAHINAGQGLPEPGDDECSQDPLLTAYFDDVVARPDAPRQFDHLIVHSDCQGFYLPQDFAHILFTGEGIEIPGDMVGSAPRLLDECNRLAQVLQIPDSIDPSSDELSDAADAQGESEVLWQRYGVESYSCVVLREGCRRSLQTGAALVFA